MFDHYVHKSFDASSCGNDPTPPLSPSRLEAIERKVLESLKADYRVHRANTFRTVDRVLNRSQAANWTDLATELHKLGGTAAHFGDELLGELSLDMEATIRRSRDETRRFAALGEFRKQLDRTPRI